MAVMTETYKPTALVGKFYSRVRGTAMPFIETGNWTQADIEQDLEEDRTPDMQVLGGGTHAKISRVKGVTLKAKTVDLNITTLARHLRATVSTAAAGTKTSEEVTLYPGGLTPLAHMGATNVTVTLKTGGTAVAAAGNYELRPEGIFVLPGSTAITTATECLVNYSHPEQLTMEPLTTAAPELEILFAGLNEADSGRPQTLEIYRASTDLLKKLPLLSSKLMDLDLEFELLSDPTKTGVGMSRFYRRKFV